MYFNVYQRGIPRYTSGRFPKSVIALRNEGSKKVEKPIMLKIVLKLAQKIGDSQLTTRSSSHGFESQRCKIFYRSPILNKRCNTRNQFFWSWKLDCWRSWIRILETANFNNTKSEFFIDAFFYFFFENDKIFVFKLNLNFEFRQRSKFQPQIRREKSFIQNSRSSAKVTR